MTPVAFCLWVFGLVGAIAAVVFLFERAMRRAEERDEARWHEESAEGMRSMVAQMRKARDDEEAFVAEHVGRPWPELRAMCEAARGHPCECPTRGKLLRGLWRKRSLDQR